MLHGIEFFLQNDMFIRTAMASSPRIDFYRPGLILSDFWLLMNIYHPNLPNKIHQAADCILALISLMENQGCIISKPGNISKHKNSWSKATLCSVYTGNCLFSRG